MINTLCLYFISFHSGHSPQEFSKHLKVERIFKDLINTDFLFLGEISSLSKSACGCYNQMIRAGMTIRL